MYPKVLLDSLQSPAIISMINCSGKNSRSSSPNLLHDNILLVCENEVPAVYREVTILVHMFQLGPHKKVKTCKNSTFFSISTYALCVTSLIVSLYVYIIPFCPISLLHTAV